MRSLATARDVCEKFHNGLLEAIEKIPLMEREGADSPVLELYRTHNGPSLLVPTPYGGQAAGPLEAVRVQRAIAAASPSLGVATVMHHFTTAMLFRLAGITARLTPAQLELLSAIAPKSLLLASGWAEGRTEQNILAPSVTAERTPTGYRVNGSKKPCSLSHSMDVLTASVMLTQPDGTSRLSLMLIPATSPGISTTPFWSTPVLAATQSDEVRLTDVEIPEDLVIVSTPEDHGRLDDLQTGGFTWFELLTTAAYTGAASALVDRVITAGRGTPADRAALGTRLDAAVGLVEGAARALQDGVDGDEAVATVLTARYASQDLLAATVDQAVEILGGMSYIGSAEVSYLASAVRALAFHPPSRASVAAEMADYFAGSPLRLS